MKTENRYFFYFLTYQLSNVFLKFRPHKKHAKNWSFWRVEKWGKKSFGLEKSHEKIFFAQTFFKLLSALKGFISDIFLLFSTFRVRVRSKSWKNLGNLLQNQWNFKSINRCWYVQKSKKSKFLIFLVGLQFLSMWTRRNLQKNVLGSENSRKSIFAADFCWILIPKSSKLMSSWWFSRPHDYFEARVWPCAGA